MNAICQRVFRSDVGMGFVAMIMLCVIPEIALGFSGSVTKRREYTSGTARMAELAGTYQLNRGERLTSVQMEHYDANGRLLSGAAGTASNGTWSVTSGDNRTVYYRVVFNVTVSGGGKRVFYSPTYFWTGKN